MGILNRTCNIRIPQHLLQWKSPHRRGRWQITTWWLSHPPLWIALCPAAMAGSLPPSWAGSKLPGITLHAPQGKSLQNSRFLGSRCHRGTFHHVLMKHTTLARATNQCLAVSCTGMEQVAVIWILLRGQVCQAVGTQAERILPLLPREPGNLALEENTYWQAPKQWFRAAQSPQKFPSHYAWCPVPPGMGM